MALSMNLAMKGVSLGLGAALLAGCAGGDLSSINTRTTGGELIVVQAATWIDPDGCEHWIFDTGVEGYMTPKLQPDGRPICGRAAAAQ